MALAVEKEVGGQLAVHPGLKIREIRQWSIN